MIHPLRKAVSLMPAPARGLFERRPLLFPLLLALVCDVPLAALGSDYQALRWTAFALLVLFLLLPVLAALFGAARHLWRRRRDGRFRRFLGLNCLCSLLLACAYPPLPLGWLSFVLLVPWLWTLRRLEARDALTITFASSVLGGAAMYFWIYNVVSVGPPAGVVCGLVLLLCFLATFKVAAGWLFLRLEAVGKTWLFPLVWAGIEVFRAQGEISFPWEHLGYALGVSLPMAQAASWIGVYGLSALVVAANLVALSALERRSRRRALAVLLFPAGLLLFGAVSLSSDAETSGTVRVAVLQPNIPQHLKWERKNFPEWMRRTFRMARAVDSGAVDLVVLPETAVPRLARDPRAPEGSGWISEHNRFRRLAREKGTDVLVGFLDADTLRQGARKFNFYNSAFLFPKEGEPTSYRKRKLVPFSEKLPWDDLLPMLNYVDLGEGDFSAGDEDAFWGDSGEWAPSICYEIIYPQFMRRQALGGARLMVNVTNDGWFGRTTAPFQHVNIARFRSVELGLPLVRAANTGVSAVFDAKGRELASTPIYEQTAFSAEVPLPVRPAPYAALGDALETALLLLALAVFALALFTRDSWRR